MFMVKTIKSWIQFYVELQVTIEISVQLKYDCDTTLEQYEVEQVRATNISAKVILEYWAFDCINCWGSYWDMQNQYQND